MRLCFSRFSFSLDRSGEQCTWKWICLFSYCMSRSAWRSIVSRVLRFSVKTVQRRLKAHSIARIGRSHEIKVFSHPKAESVRAVCLLTLTRIDSSSHWFADESKHGSEKRNKSSNIVMPADQIYGIWMKSSQREAYYFSFHFHFRALVHKFHTRIKREKCQQRARPSVPMSHVACQSSSR